MATSWWRSTTARSRKRGCSSASSPPRAPIKMCALIVLRPEGRRPLAVRLSTMPRLVAGERVAVEFGFALREIEPPAAARDARPPSETPAVAAVIPRSAAARAGLEVGDAIVQINDHAVLTREAAREVLADVDPDTAPSARRRPRRATAVAHPVHRRARLSDRPRDQRDPLRDRGRAPRRRDRRLRLRGALLAPQERRRLSAASRRRTPARPPDRPGRDRPRGAGRGCGPPRGSG